MSNKKITEIDITPSTSIYNTFKNLNYKHQEAISELIDNSTQSFRDQKKKKEIIPKIYIIFFEQEMSLKIIDNCFGVKDDHIDRILKLNVPAESKISRNEFGMGLKTSGFWMGKNIEILSSNIDNNDTFELSLNLKDLSNIKDNKIKIKRFPKDYYKEKTSFEFGTQITIKEIYKNKKITINKMAKIAKTFSSRYRNDFKFDNLQIICAYFDKNNKFWDCSNEDNLREINELIQCSELSFIPPKIKIINGKEVKIDINTSFEFDNKIYSITGWIGVLEKGSRSQPGLTLFRRERTIKGDNEDNQYKPKKIFGDAGTFEYQRITGWLNLDDFPVNQQKNDFLWEGEMEELFIETIIKELEVNKKIFDIKKIARQTREEKSGINKGEFFTDEAIKELNESFSCDNNPLNIEVDKVLDEKKELIHKFTIIEKNNRHSNGVNYIFFLRIVNNEQNKENIKKNWLIIKRKSGNEFDLFLDIDIEWFSPFNKDKEYIYQIIKLAVYFAYSECKHAKICGGVATEIRNTLNDCFAGEIKIEDRE